MSEGPRNIAIQLTAPGAAAIAVIRLTGPGVSGFLAKHFSKPAAPHRCVHGELKDGDRVIDDPVVVMCDHTTVDLNVHGGPWVVRSLLDLSRREGFEIVEPVSLPLSPSAVDAQTELQREVLSYLPLARTELGVRVLLAQERAWAELKSRVVGSKSIADIEHVLSDPTLTYLLYPPAVAIVGLANVGKSTLANQLFAQERSITADVPGTTRDWVGEIANIDGLPVMLVDTPGLRITQDQIERTAIERAGEQIERSQLLIVVFDATRPLDGEQAQLLARYPKALKLVNKSDCTMTPGMTSLDAIRTVATTGQGIDELRMTIVQFFCGDSEVSVNRPRCWTARQRDIVKRSLADLAALCEI